MINIPLESEYPKHLLDEADKLKPSSDPSYWAKKGCKDCCGRGIVGTTTQILKGNNRVQHQLVCHCTRKRYRTWLETTIRNLEKDRSKDVKESDPST